MTRIYNFTHPIDKLINYNMKKKLLNIGVALLLLAGCTSKQKVEPVIPRDAEIEKRVEATLKKMTLEEKVGQMTQLNITSLGHNDFRTGKFILDEDKLETIFGKYKVGSILNNPSSVPPTNREWTEIMTTIQKWSMESMGIPCIMGLDQNHGTTYTSGGTMFPQNIHSTQMQLHVQQASLPTRHVLLTSHGHSVLQWT